MPKFIQRLLRREPSVSEAARILNQHKRAKRLGGLTVHEHCRAIRESMGGQG